MSTRKSKQVRNPKHLTAEELDKELNGSDEDSRDKLAEEEITINKRLSECGFADEGFNLQEKKDILKVINVSVHSAEFEKSKRQIDSPKLADNSKLEAEKKSKEHTIEITLDDTPPDTENQPIKSSDTKTPILEGGKNLVNYIVSSLGFGNKTTRKVEYGDVTISKTPSDQCNKVNPIKVSLGNSNSNITNSKIGSDSEEEIFTVSKKRQSPPDLIEEVDSAKKLRIESPPGRMNVSRARKPLKTEIEMEKRRRSVVFKNRSAKAIQEELEQTIVKWKEAAAKFTYPTRWGNPIVKHCSEKWDFRVVPPHLSHRYQKFLSGTNSQSPPPVNSPKAADIDPDIIDDTSQDVNSCKNENIIEDGENINVTQNDSNESKTSTNPKRSEENFGREIMNGSQEGSRKNPNARKCSQNKRYFNDEYENNEESDNEDWLSNEPNQAKNNKRKPRTNARTYKNKNKVDVAVIPIARYGIFKSKNAEVANNKANAAKSNAINASSGREEPESSSQDLIPENDADVEKVDCPICNKPFRKTDIEDHASECATKAYMD